MVLQRRNTGLGGLQVVGPDGGPVLYRQEKLCVRVRSRRASTRRMGASPLFGVFCKGVTWAFNNFSDPPRDTLSADFPAG